MKETKICVIGLGYVGLPLAIEYGKKYRVIGFDIYQARVDELNRGEDHTLEADLVGMKQARDAYESTKKIGLTFTSHIEDLKQVNTYIVTVPTPIDRFNNPDLTPLLKASETIGKTLNNGDLVIYESTVYPGVTEDECIPVVERVSGLKYNVDFYAGYSPERINPGDKVHRLETITKIVSGMDEETLDIVAKVYELVVEAGVYKAESIKVAEAAKVIENSQRDINIAFMNELSIIFNKMGIDTKAVLQAAGTKWNFLNFAPGLVGGHCIGVDPYYLTYKAEELGYHSQIILSGRRINDDMGKYVAENVIKHLIKADIPVKNAKVGLLGFTFKENCPDTRNTKIVDIVNELNEYGISPIVADPAADADEAKRLYGVEFVDMEALKELDALILAVAHEQFKEMTMEQFDSMYKDKKVLIDIKGILDRKKYEEAGYLYWRL